MTFFTTEEFQNKYNQEVAEWQIEIASEMIYNQVGIKYRDPSWSSDTCPTPIKNASMEQLRFILEYDIPALDNRGSIKAGAMESDLISDISSYALRMLGNAGYLYRGNPMNFNMGITYPYGD